MKLWPRVWCLVFLTHGVYVVCMKMRLSLTVNNTTVRRVSAIESWNDTDHHKHYTAVALFGQVWPCCASISISNTKTQEAQLSQRDCPRPMLDWPWSQSRSSEMARFDKPQACITSYCLSVVTTPPTCTVSEILPVLAVSGCCCCCCCCCKHATQCNKKLTKPIILDVNSPWPRACRWQGRFPPWGRCV